MVAVEGFSGWTSDKGSQWIWVTVRWCLIKKKKKISYKLTFPPGCISCFSNPSSACTAGKV